MSGLYAPKLSRSAIAWIAALALAAPAAACSQSSRPEQHGAQRIEQLTPHVYLIGNQRGNLAVLINSGTALVAGLQDSALVREARTLLASHSVRFPRFVVATDGTGAEADGDGGWGKLGSLAFAQENLRHRIRRSHGNGAVPEVGFSEVLQIRVGDGEAHAVHQPAGHNDADVIVHFEGDGIVFLGEAFGRNGYPVIDVASGGSADSLVKSLSFFASSFASSTRFIPARGPIATRSDLEAYVTMVTQVRDRVKALQATGASSAAVVAAHPAAEYDARWGRGAVTSDAFVQAVDASLRRK